MSFRRIARQAGNPRLRGDKFEALFGQTYASRLLRFLQKTLNPESRHVESIFTIPSLVLPLFSTIRNTLCRKMASSFFSSRGGAIRNMPLLPQKHPSVAMMWQCGLKHRKSPKVCMEMAAPGVGSFSGTASRRNIFSDSQYRWITCSI